MQKAKEKFPFFDKKSHLLSNANWFKEICLRIMKIIELKINKDFKMDFIKLKSALEKLRLKIAKMNKIIY